MRLWKLETCLHKVDGFENPKDTFEQYATSPHIAATILHDAQMRDDSVTKRIVADLGCGTGRFAIGSLLLDCHLCVGFDIDGDALNQVVKNYESMDLEDEDVGDLQIVQTDILKDWADRKDVGRWTKFFDTVFTNPPFGAGLKCTENADLGFLWVALQLSRKHVYSLHKYSTRKEVVRFIKSKGAKCEALEEVKFDLPRTYKHQKFKSKDINVVLIHSWFE